MPTPKPNFKEETIKVKNEAIPAKELKEEKSEPIKQPESSSELKEDNQSLSLPDLPPIVDIDDDKKEKNSIVFDNNESPLEKTIKENKEEPVKTSPNIPKEEKRVYPKVSLHKDSDDPPRAIIVTVSQFKNLQQSKVKKKNEIIENELSEEEPKIEEKPTEEDEILPVINIDNNIADIKDITGNQEDTSTTEEIISNNKVIEEKSTPEEKNNQIIEETPKDDVEESIEQMLERANNLYKEGKLQESQALYEKISNLNKAKQNEDKVYVKTA